LVNNFPLLGIAFLPRCFGLRVLTRFHKLSRQLGCTRVLRQPFVSLSQTRSLQKSTLVPA
jgi:hypothetical protein